MVVLTGGAGGGLGGGFTGCGCELGINSPEPANRISSVCELVEMVFGGPAFVLCSFVPCSNASVFVVTKGNKLSPPSGGEGQVALRSS
jgi:hypothetical protein